MNWWSNVPTFNLKSINIEAIYACVPSTKVKTEDFPFFDKVQSQLFTKSTGVIERRVANQKTTCSDLCFSAANSLISDLKCLEEIDLLLFVSQSPDYFLPATSILLQEKLGLPEHIMAFDINLGCSGFIYGLITAAQYIQSGAVRKALLLVGDKSTISTHPQDRSTTPLFGDAGTATLISASSDHRNMAVDAGTDGRGRNAIIIPGGHSRHPYGSFDASTYEFEGLIRTKNHLHLDGLAVFNFALQQVPCSIDRILEQANITMDNVDFVVLHQANQLISNTIEKKLKIPSFKMLHSITNFGNTSSASIPLTIAWNNKNENDSASFTWIMCGFGVGFSWSTICIDMPWPITKMFDYEGTEE